MDIPHSARPAFVYFHIAKLAKIGDFPVPGLHQPRELAELKGAHLKNPQRYRTTVPKSKLPIGDYPVNGSTDPKECWFELEALAIPGVLTGADRVMLEVLANLLADYRKDRSGFQTTRLAQMILIMARLGMSPADRNKLGVNKPKDDENPYAALDS